MAPNKCSRRAFLGTAGICGTAGCLTPLLPDWSDDRPRLGTVLVANLHDESIVVDFRIERNAEEVYHETVDIPSPGREFIEPTWSSKPAEYELYWVTDVEPAVQYYEYSQDYVRDSDCSVLLLGLHPEEQYRHPDGDFEMRHLPAEHIDGATCNL